MQQNTECLVILPLALFHIYSGFRRFSIISSSCTMTSCHLLLIGFSQFINHSCCSNQTIFTSSHLYGASQVMLLILPTVQQPKTTVAPCSMGQWYHELEILNCFLIQIYITMIQENVDPYLRLSLLLSFPFFSRDGGSTM